MNRGLTSGPTGGHPVWWFLFLGTVLQRLPLAPPFGNFCFDIGYWTTGGASGGRMGRTSA